MSRRFFIPSTPARAGTSRVRHLGRLASGALLLALCTFTQTGCDTISEITGMVSMAQGLSKHLEEDIKAPLTDERISKVLEVLPKLTEFSKEAKVKWKPDPEDHDMAQLGTMIAGMSEYAAFFESHDTRLSQFYVDFSKIADCRARARLREGIEESRKKLKKEAAELEEKIEEAPEEEKPELERRLKQAQIAIEKLDSGKDEVEKVRNEQAKNTGYKITPEERALVEARHQEIEAVLEASGFGSKSKKKAADTDDSAAGAPDSP